MIIMFCIVFAVGLTTIVYWEQNKYNKEHYMIMWALFIFYLIGQMGGCK